MPWHKQKMQADIDREKRNIFLCMNPAATVEQERALYKEIDKEEDELAFKLNKAYIESVVFAPKPLKAHYKPLLKTGTWQKF